MLRLTVPPRELFDEKTNLFETTRETVLCLEHSLISISKWESKWLKPFLTKTPKSAAETLDYICCMTLTQNVPPLVYRALSAENMAQIQAYIESPMTATWFKNQPGKVSRDVVTSELIYYWMIACGIPMECEKWHINRLLTLIRVCNEKNKTPQKKNPKQRAASRSALNAARRRQYGSRGRL